MFFVVFQFGYSSSKHLHAQTAETFEQKYPKNENSSMLRPDDTYHGSDDSVSKPNESNQSSAHQSPRPNDETETIHAGLLAGRESTAAAIPFIPTNPPTASHRPQETASQKKERSGSKRKKRDDTASDHNTNPSVEIHSSAPTGKYNRYNIGMNASTLLPPQLLFLNTNTTMHNLITFIFRRHWCL
jgi:hypothetical protein